MVRSKVFPITSIVLILHPVFSVSAYGYTYTVQEGDTLSHHVAGVLIPGPVWGKNGSLKKILRLNPGIKDPNHLVPGDQINLGDLYSGTFVQAIRAPAEEPLTQQELIPPTFKRESHLSLSPSYAMTTLSATDPSTGSTSTFASELALGINVRYFQDWTPKFQSFIGLNLGEVVFEPPTNSSIILDNRSQIMSGVSFGGNFVLSPDFQLTTTVKYQKELFARSISTSEVTVDAVSLPEFEVEASYDLVSLSPFKLGISGAGEAIFPGSIDSYSVHWGSLYGGSVYLKEKDYQTDLGFFTRSQNSSLVHQTENDLILSVRISFGSSQSK
jgi:hypothetical protein